MQGSTETTFYVLAVYFGSVGIHRYRHAMYAGLVADFMGVVGSILAVPFAWLNALDGQSVSEWKVCS